VAIIPSDFMKEPRCAVELYTAEEMSSFDVTTELKYISYSAFRLLAAAANLQDQ
jgi:hypothetical protein